MKLKTHKRYWFYRIYMLLVLILWNATYFLEDQMFYSTVLIPFFIPAFLMLYNFWYFRFDVSLFGRYERIAFPKKNPEEKIRYMYETYYFFDKGVGIKVIGLYNIYILYSQITEIKPYVFFLKKVVHTNKECRLGFHTVQSEAFIEELQKRLKRRS